jgi:hypothetical protein
MHRCLPAIALVATSALAPVPAGAAAAWSLGAPGTAAAPRAGVEALAGAEPPTEGQPRAPTAPLAGVERLAVTADVVHPVEGLDTAELMRLLTTAVQEHRPPPAIDAASSDRLRLTVAVRPRSSSELRGFPLPFSGTYGIGIVRLALERRVLLPGAVPRPAQAIVWQGERLIAARWAATGAAVAAAIGELLDELRRPDGARRPASGAADRRTLRRRRSGRRGVVVGRAARANTDSGTRGRGRRRAHVPRAPLAFLHGPLKSISRVAPGSPGP